MEKTFWNLSTTKVYYIALFICATHNFRGVECSCNFCDLLQMQTCLRLIYLLKIKDINLLDNVQEMVSTNVLQFLSCKSLFVSEDCEMLQ